MFNTIEAPLSQLHTWYTECSKAQEDAHLCHRVNPSSHSQFFTEFSIFASTVFLPYHLARYVDYYTRTGQAQGTMEDYRENMAKSITGKFSGIFQVGCSLLRIHVGRSDNLPSSLWNSERPETRV
jgi:hypothetical protein